MSRSLLDVLSPTDASQSGKVYGVVVGVVTNNRDPDNQGRVKVRFPWLSDSEESWWARIATGMAGPSRGSYFLPEVDDEVLVAFDHGDMRFPYVLGGLWNGKDAPPENNSNGENNIRVIHSRNGHTLKFDDKKGAENFEIKSSSGHIVRLDDKPGSEKIEVIDKTGSNHITIQSLDNSMAIECKGKLSIKALAIEISADTDVKIEGVTANLNGSALVKIQGGMVTIN
jgi:uncharacterized protein involved in type VI secretion and phage assembly